MGNVAEKELVDALLKDRRRSRLWRNLRAFFWMVFFLFYFHMLTSSASDEMPSVVKQHYVSLVKIQGPIMPSNDNSAMILVHALQHAFADSKSEGVVLLVNSPGGSAVQSALVHDEIIHLKKEFHKKVVVVAEDMLTSGAYYIASAADKIYTNESTITGSIGVVLGSFSVTGLMEKVGVKRRLFTAGEFKGQLDPFSPMIPGEKAKIDHMLAGVHQQFIQAVKSGRGKRLVSNPDLFNGDFWAGNDALKYGLIDGFGNLWSVMHKEFNVSHFRDYTHQKPLFYRFFEGVSGRLGVPVHSSVSLMATL